MNQMMEKLVVVGAVLLPVLVPAPSAGQTAAGRLIPSDPFPAPAAALSGLSGPEGPLELRRDGVRTLTGVLAGGALLLIPVDGAVREWAQSRGQEIPLILSLDGIFRPLGGRLAYGAGAMALVAGAVTGDDALRDAGLHVEEAVLSGVAARWIAQRLIGRRRPFSEPSDPHDFGFARGFGARELRSFPSGHAATAFALANAVGIEMVDGWDDEGEVLAVALFTAAGITAFSRVVDDQHWLSDVVAGAALGVLMSSIIMDVNGH